MVFVQLCLVKFRTSPVIPGAFTFIVLFRQDLPDLSYVLGFLVWEHTHLRNTILVRSLLFFWQRMTILLILWLQV